MAVMIYQSILFKLFHFRFHTTKYRTGSTTTADFL